MEFETLIRGGTVTTAEASFRADVGITGGRITAVAAGLPSGAREIDASGLLVMPGAIDVHTHFDRYHARFDARNADDYDSGSRAAAVGGITSVINFAFQAKGSALRPAIEDELARAEGRSYIDYGIHQGVTDLSVPGVMREIPRLADEGFASVKIFMTTPAQLADSELLRILALTRDDGIMINVHAEDNLMISHLTDELVAAGKTSVEHLPASRPPVTEELATFRMATYARVLRTPVYFVHVSSALAMRAIRRAREDGGEVYAETRPTYLYLDESRYALPDREGNKFACLPPLREAWNQQVLWDGLRNGEIQTYATDHAPWTAEQKLDPSRGFHQLPAGVANVQTSIGMLFSEGVNKQRMSANEFVRAVSTNPAKLFGMWPQKGTITPEADADIVLIDPNRPVTVRTADMLSKAGYDPYEGYQGVGWPVATMLRGTLVAAEGKIVVDRPTGRLLKRDRYRSL